jgi:plastocyanin
VSNTGTVLEGASAQGQTTGVLYWKVPEGISGGYRYQCSFHAAMVGSITIKSFAAI